MAFLKGVCLEGALMNVCKHASTPVHFHSGGEIRRCQTRLDVPSYHVTREWTRERRFCRRTNTRACFRLWFFFLSSCLDVWISFFFFFQGSLLIWVWEKYLNVINIRSSLRPLKAAFFIQSSGLSFDKRGKGRVPSIVPAEPFCSLNFVSF